MDGQTLPTPPAADVVVLGDSNVFGLGLAEENTLAHQLYERFGAVGTNTRVLNAGVPGYGLDQMCLRLRSLGRLRPGTWVICLIHPVNDCVNASCVVDYGQPRPYPEFAGDRLVFPSVAQYDPQTYHHFGPGFSALNYVFALPAATPPTLADRLLSHSRALTCLRSAGTLRLRSRQTAVTVGGGGPPDLEDAITDRLAAVGQNPLIEASRYWPEIGLFVEERERLRLRVRAVFRMMAEYVAARDGYLLIVIAPEAFRTQQFQLRVTNLVQERVPGLKFEWGWTQAAVAQCAIEAGATAVQPAYDPDRIEYMYQHYDDHISAEGFAVLSDAIFTAIGASPQP